MRHLQPLTGSSQEGTLTPYQTGQKERIAQIRLARTSGIGPRNFAKFLGEYGSAERVLEALPQFYKTAGRNFIPGPTQSEIEDEIASLEKDNIVHLLRSDPNYPILLSHIPDAPPLLYVKGDISKLSAPSIGIIGARNASINGYKIAENIATELAHANIVIVSGLARGIDTATHQGALSRGMTVAALASSIDCPYPPENTRLQEEIAQTGCLITEAPPGTTPIAQHFPRRNRLIAGLSIGCLIIEASLKSGTLITANLANDYDRMLFAVPGFPLDPRSRGGNQLLRDGAILVETARDILNELPQELPHLQEAPWIRPRTPINDLFTHTPLTQNISSDSHQNKDHKSDLSPSNMLNNDAEQKTLKKNIPATDRQNISPKKTKTLTKPQEKNISDPCLSEDTPEKLLLSLLSPYPVTVDAIASRCQLSVPVIIGILGKLELDGVVKAVAGGGYTLLSSIEEKT